MKKIQLNKIIMENKIDQLKEQLTVELQRFIGMPNNKHTQRQMLWIIQDLIDRFNSEGHHITLDDVMFELNDIRLTFSNYERNTTEENN